MDPFIRADPTAATLSIDAGKMVIRSVITTDKPDRSGDVVVPGGLKNADEFLLNPVVLWAHNRSAVPPIGRFPGNSEDSPGMAGARGSNAHMI